MGSLAGEARRQAIVVVSHLSKSLGEARALRDVSLSVGSGEIYGLIGPNGAGKSTLLKVLLGFLYPDEGSVRLFGLEDTARTHSRLGYLPEQTRYHGNFTGQEYLQFHGRLLGLSLHDAGSASARLLEMVGLGAYATRRINTYSKGMKQRFGLAVALLTTTGNPPELLILDEPASGLDPEGQVAVREVILDCRRRGSTVLLCSHQLTEVERVCTSVGILRAGRLVVQTRLDEGPRVNIAARPLAGAMEIAPHLLEYLRSLHPAVIVKGGQMEGEALLVILPAGPAVPRASAMKSAAIRAMMDADWDITSIYMEGKDLESLYLHAVRPRDSQNQEALRPQAEGGLKEENASTSHPTTPLPTLEPRPTGGKATGPLSPLPTRPTSSKEGAE